MEVALRVLFVFGISGVGRISGLHGLAKARLVDNTSRMSIFDNMMVTT